jgi:hypothetical protein
MQYCLVAHLGQRNVFGDVQLAEFVDLVQEDSISKALA